jgi:hypothetical protein
MAQGSRFGHIVRLSLEKGLCVRRGFFGSIVVAALFIAAVAVGVYIIVRDCPCSYCDAWTCLRESFGMRWGVSL